MRHDFGRDDKKNCNGDGIMSYKSKQGREDLIQRAWSVCSINDIENWFLNKGFSCETIEYGETQRILHAPGICLIISLHSGDVNCGWGKRNSCGNCGAPHLCGFDCQWSDVRDRCVPGDALGLCD